MPYRMTPVYRRLVALVVLLAAAWFFFPSGSSDEDNGLRHLGATPAASEHARAPAPAPAATAAAVAADDTAAPTAAPGTPAPVVAPPAPAPAAAPSDPALVPATTPGPPSAPGPHESVATSSAAAPAPDGAIAGAESLIVPPGPGPGLDLALRSANRLNIRTAGTGQGQIDSKPTGLRCRSKKKGSKCSVTFDKATRVTLTAHPSNSNEFGGWSGAGCFGTVLICTVRVNQIRRVEARFEPKVGRFELSRDTFIASRNPTRVGPSARALYGTQLTFRITGNSLVRFIVRHLPHRAGPDITYSFNRRLRAGEHRVHYTATFGRRTYAPGDYEVLARAIDESTGFRSQWSRDVFRVIRRR